MKVDRKSRVKTLSIKRLAKFSPEICVQNHQQTTFRLSQMRRKRILCQWTKQRELASPLKKCQFYPKGCWLLVSSRKRANCFVLFGVFDFSLCAIRLSKEWWLWTVLRNLSPFNDNRDKDSSSCKVAGLSHCSVVPFSNIRWHIRDIRPSMSRLSEFMNFCDTVKTICIVRVPWKNARF